MDITNLAHLTSVFLKRRRSNDFFLQIAKTVLMVHARDTGQEISLEKVEHLAGVRLTATSLVRTTITI